MKNILSISTLVVCLLSLGFFFFMNRRPSNLYKVLSPADWAESQSSDRLKLSSMDDAFIHLSTEKQLAGVLDKFWKDQPCLVATVMGSLLPGRLVFEANRPGGDKYYHLYDGYIPCDAVIAVEEKV